MNTIIAALIKKPKITLIFFIAAVILGTYSFMTLPSRENPEISITTAVVQTIYPGASAQKIEQLVTKPLEDKINEIENIKKIKSTSKDGASLIIVELQPVHNGGAYKKTWEILRQKLLDAEGKLPDDAEKPQVNDKLSTIAGQILHLTVNDELNMEDLRPISEQWKNELRSVTGVSSIQINGLAEQQVRIELDMEQLERYQLSWEVIAQTLSSSQNRVPIGSITKDGKSLLLNLTGEWTLTQDIKETVIYRKPAEGTSLKLKDVAKVVVSTKNPKDAIYYNGKPSIDIVINAGQGVDIPALQQAIDIKTAVLKSTLPGYVTVESMFSQAEGVQVLFSELTRELIIGMLSVIVVCSLGLNMGTALIVTLAIPISIAIGIIPLRFFDIDLNQITIVSLVIVLGILVDDAVVVNDNIEQRLQLGDSPQTASLEGSREVSISILTATLATAAAFFPLYFLTGNIGEYIRPIPVVVSLTLVASMVMSLTIIPIYRRWLGQRKNRRLQQAMLNGKLTAAVSGYTTPGLLGRGIDHLSIWYEKQLKRFLQKPLLTGVVAILLGTSSFLVLPFLGLEYFPKAEKVQFLIDVSMPVSSTLEDNSGVIRGISAWAVQQPGIVSVSGYAGRTSPKFDQTSTESTGSRIGQVFVEIDKNRIHTKELIKPWREQLNSMYPSVDITPRELESGPAVGTPVSIRISGADLNELSLLSRELQHILSQIPGTVNISDDMGEKQLMMDLQLDKEKAGLYGVTEKELASTLRLATDGIKVSTLYVDDKSVDVVFYHNKHGAAVDAIDQLLVISQTGKLYTVKEFISYVPNEAIQSIHRQNLERVVTVGAYTDEGVLASEVMKKLQPQLAKLQLPAGYQISIGGESESRNDAFASIGQLSIIVVIIIYILMAMQFYSLSIPLLILSTVYLAAGGAVLGLYFTGSPIGFMALMGMISLSGIVVRNGIVLIEFIEQAQKRGIPLREAVVQGGKARLRPILLTTMTAIAGMTPMAIMGGSMWGPMAVCIISGLIVSTVLTLIVVPSLFYKLETWRHTRKTETTLNTPTE